MLIAFTTLTVRCYYLIVILTNALCGVGVWLKPCTTSPALPIPTHNTATRTDASRVVGIRDLVGIAFLALRIELIRQVGSDFVPGACAVCVRLVMDTVQGAPHTRVFVFIGEDLVANANALGLIRIPGETRGTGLTRWRILVVNINNVTVVTNALMEVIVRVRVALALRTPVHNVLCLLNVEVKQTPAGCFTLGDGVFGTLYTD